MVRSHCTFKLLPHYPRSLNNITTMPLLHLPNEILIQIASYLTVFSLAQLILTNTLLKAVLTPLLQTRALEPKRSIPALCWAILAGYEPLVRLLLEKGVNVNHKIDAKYTWAYSIYGRPFKTGITVLHLAAIKAPPSIIKLLLDAGADTNAVDVDGFTPLGVAVEWISYSTVRMLLDAGADVNAHFCGRLTVLHIAVGGRDAEMMRILLSANPDLEAHDENGGTPLHWACRGFMLFMTPDMEKASSELVRLLLDAGADVNARHSVSGDSPLHALVQSKAEFSTIEAVVRILVEKGGNMDIKNIRGRTAYDVASQYPDAKKFLDLLLELGADIGHIKNIEA